MSVVQMERREVVVTAGCPLRRVDGGQLDEATVE